MIRKSAPPDLRLAQFAIERRAVLDLGMARRAAGGIRLAHEIAGRPCGTI